MAGDDEGLGDGTNHAGGQDVGRQEEGVAAGVAHHSRAGDGGAASRRGHWTAAGLGTAGAAVFGLSLAFGAGQDPVTPPEVTPSSSPTTITADERGPRLGPDGLLGLTLGEPVDPKAWSTFYESGCNRGLNGLTEELVRLGVGTRVRVETDDEDVVAITLVELSRSVEAPGTPPDVWLGPTLGDPIADALSLPGARIITEDPRDNDGPGITSVLIDTEAGQIVFANPPYDQATSSDGRISHITLRLGEEVRCPLFDAAAQLRPGQPADPDAPVATFDATGTADIRLGDPVADAEQAGLLLGDPLPPPPGSVPERLTDCNAWTTTDGTNTVVLADQAGRIVAVGSGGPGIGFTTTLGLSPGQRADEAARLLGAEPPPVDAGFRSGPGGVAIEGMVAPGVQATVLTYPELLPVETIDAWLTGPLLVAGLTVHLADDGPEPLC